MSTSKRPVNSNRLSVISQMSEKKRVVIVGGGITGLAATYRLQQSAVPLALTLVEREPQVGGKIVTERANGFVIEGGPDCFLSRKPRGIGLCEELGVADRLHGRNPAHQKTFVKRQNRLYPLPEGLTGMIPTNLDALADSPLISSAGQMRLAQEPELPPRPANGDESVADFIIRRLGREVYERLVEPLMGGIYAGDASQLSLAATFPQLRQLELKHGSLLKGLLAAQPNQTAVSEHPPFVAFPSGMAELVETLLARLDQTTILTNTAVSHLTRQENSYRLTLANGQQLTADFLLLTTPAYVTAGLLYPLDEQLAQAHADIPYASSVTISLAYRQTDLPQVLDGYGYVIPRAENTDVLACTWTSSKWEGRAPDGHTLVRVYAGRFGRRDVTQDNDNALLALAQTELRETLAIDAVPLFGRVYRWQQGMPQYNLGHPDRLALIEERLARHRGLYLAGAAYRGVGIPDCIQSAEKAAKQIMPAEE
jgi:protoporphyrinogen/coproporphyrinogen III oxidase